MDLTVKEVAERLGKDNRLIRLWCKQGRFPNARLEETPRGGVWLIPEKDLRGFQEPQMGRPTKEKVSKKTTKKR